MIFLSLLKGSLKDFSFLAKKWGYQESFMFTFL